jgi:cyclic-di-GMP-binding protein
LHNCGVVAVDEPMALICSACRKVPKIPVWLHRSARDGATQASGYRHSGGPSRSGEAGIIPESACAEEETVPSFDVVSRVDMQEMDNAVNQVRKEVASRYDFRGSKTQVEFDRKEGSLRFVSEDDMKLRALRELLIEKSVRRGIDTAAFEFGTPEKAGGDMLRQEVSVVNGIEQETARKVVKLLKDAKIKVQASIQGEEVRVTGKKRDDLQAAIGLLREEDLGIPLQFVNMRE